jgi:hypothetical protein
MNNPLQAKRSLGYRFTIAKKKTPACRKITGRQDANFMISF